jgi:hypothetical protein
LQVDWAYVEVEHIVGALLHVLEEYACAQAVLHEVDYVNVAVLERAVQAFLLFGVRLWYLVVAVLEVVEDALGRFDVVALELRLYFGEPVFVEEQERCVFLARPYVGLRFVYLSVEESDHVLFN